MHARARGLRKIKTLKTCNNYRADVRTVDRLGGYKHKASGKDCEALTELARNQSLDICHVYTGNSNIPLENYGRGYQPLLAGWQSVQQGSHTGSEETGF